MKLSDYGIELHLVRHGEYELNKVGGWTDDHLSAKGYIQSVTIYSDIKPFLYV